MPFVHNHTNPPFQLTLPTYLPFPPTLPTHPMCPIHDWAHHQLCIVSCRPMLSTPTGTGPAHVHSHHRTTATPSCTSCCGLLCCVLAAVTWRHCCPAAVFGPGALEAFQRGFKESVESLERDGGFSFGDTLVQGLGQGQGAKGGAAAVVPGLRARMLPEQLQAPW